MTVAKKPWAKPIICELELDERVLELFARAASQTKDLRLKPQK